MYTPDQFMNPGPAPRPPTDRPKLTLPTGNPVATSFSQMSLNSPSTPGPGGNLSLFPNTSTPSLNRSQTAGSQGGIAIIKEGYVRCKEDKFLATWNQRYLVLRDFKVDFLKSESGKVVLSFPLSTVTAVARSEESKMAFEITRLANPKDAASKAAMITRDVPTKTITCEVKSDDEIYEWIDKIYERCPGMGGVSNPTNFSHRVHVGFDPQTGAFVGLPPEWEKLLTASAITKEDYKKNPQIRNTLLAWVVRPGSPSPWAATRWVARLLPLALLHRVLCSASIAASPRAPWTARCALRLFLPASKVRILIVPLNSSSNWNG